MRYNSNYTGRTPRTMEEACGPYHRGGLTGSGGKIDWSLVIIIASGISTAIISGFFVLSTYYHLGVFGL